MHDRAERLARQTLELVDIPSESGDERVIREHLLDLVSAELELEAAADEAFLFLPRARRDVPLVLLVGHYDTVPAQGNLPGQIDDGSVHGLGASDMKGGLAVALELLREADGGRAPALDVGLLVFGREELPAELNPLPALFTSSAAIHDAALAIVLEPTNVEIHAGCLGNVVARLRFRGRSGHSARPWLADNAIAHAVAAVGLLLDVAPRPARVGGLEFQEVVSVTRLEAGVADNVIPGEATATLNFRYAPDRTPEDALAHVELLASSAAEVEIVGHSRAGAVVTDAPLVRELQRCGGLALAPKQAWTNVADFTARGIDAINFGPGDPAFAHRVDERVEIAALVRTYEVLRAFLARA